MTIVNVCNNINYMIQEEFLDMLDFAFHLFQPYHVETSFEFNLCQGFLNILWNHIQKLHATMFFSKLLRFLFL